MQGDEIRLQQVLINIVKNALKFTSQGSIKIHTYYNYVEQTLVVHVRDTGCGIAPENLTKLFKRFGKL